MFRNDEVDLKCLHRWRKQCLEWCYDRLGDNKFADQKYLDEWPELYGDSFVIGLHPGIGVAPWNVSDAMLRKSGHFFTVKNKPVAFYHFHGFQEVAFRKFFAKMLYPYHAEVASAINELYRCYVYGLRGSEKFLTGCYFESQRRKTEKASRHSHKQIRILIASLLRGDVFLSRKDRLPYEHPFHFVVLTPNYNMADYLEETIQSVLKNLQPGDEYFIVDGGSTDDSVEIIKRYENRISGWISEPDEGYADALRKGFEMSPASLMCWINSGDLLLSGTLDLVRNMFACSNADLLFGDDYYIDEEGAILQHSSGYVKNLGKVMLYGGWTPLQDACYWRRSLYDSIGGIDSTIRYAADYDFFLRMSLKGRCEYFHAVLSAFRRHEYQKSIAGADAYASERRSIRSSSLNNSNASWFSDLFYRTFYRAKIYQRAHIKCLNQKESENIGASIGAVSASLMTGTDS